MRRVRVGHVIRLASAGLLVALLIGVLVPQVREPVHELWETFERAEEHAELRRGVPQGGKNESEDIQEREQQAFNRLAYPATTIPWDWREKARNHIKTKVPKGKHFFDGAPESAAVTDASTSAVAASQDSSQPSAAQADALIAVDGTSWTSMGPAPIDNNAASGGYKYGLVGGRINSIAVDPNNSAVAYAGAASGGLWKTTNCCTASTTWTPLLDNDSVIGAPQAIGAIKIDPTNSNVVYAGTGDGDAADQYGGGILKTTDGGATWSVKGANVFAPFAPGTPDKPEQNVTAIEVDPNRPNTVLVGTRHGFFVSYDAGETWTRYDVHARSGQSQRVSSIVVDATTNPTTLYVAIGYPYTSRLYGNIGGGNGVYKATVPASGAPSFTLLNSGWPTGTGGGTSNAVGRIRLAKSPKNPQLIYAQVSDYANTNALGTWVTTNGGSTWAQLSGSADANYKNCSNQATGEGQDWYDLFITIDPNDDHILYIGRTSLYKAVVNSTYTGFSGITDLANVYATSCAGYGSIHPDQHAAAMLSDGKFLVGNDGGLYIGTGAVGGFTHMNNGPNTIQFYAGQLDDNFATSSTQYAFAGSQDNGSEGRSAASTGLKWEARGNGGDGFFAAFDPLGGTITAGNWYTEYTYGDLDCSTSGADGPFASCAGGWYSMFGSQVDRSDWSTPFVLDQLHCTATNCRNLALGTYRLWASGTGGTARSAWTAVSADLTKGNVTTDVAANTIIDVRLAPSNPKSVVVGTDDGNVQWSNSVFGGTACTQAAANTASFSCTPNSSATWVNLTGGNSVLPNRAILGVGFDPTNDQVVYAAVGGFNPNTPTTPGHVFQASCTANCTTAAGWSWVDKTSNLPDVPAQSIIVNPNNRKQVFLGTQVGFFYTNDIDAASVVWTRYMNGLPNTIVQYLTIDRGATTLGAFTYGRSLYTIALPGSGGFGGTSPTATPAGATATPAPVTATPVAPTATPVPPTATPATTVVAAPSNLQASATNKTRIQLTWADNSNNEGGFSVERSTNQTTWTVIGTTAANVTSVTNSNLTRGTTYYYRVRAFVGSTYSAYSNVAQATTP